MSNRVNNQLAAAALNLIIAVGLHALRHAFFDVAVGALSDILRIEKLFAKTVEVQEWAFAALLIYNACILIKKRIISSSLH